MIKHKLIHPIVSILICNLLFSILATKAHAEDAVMDVWEFHVLNNTLLTTIDIEKTLSPFVGPQRSFNDIDAARATLQKRYRDLGYNTVFVEIPEQEINQGIVNLHVLEGKVSHLFVSGAKYHSPKILKQTVASLSPGEIPHWPQMQKELGFVNKGLSTVPLLRQGYKPGELAVELKVNDKLPLSAGVELNNRHSNSTTPLRLGLSLRYDNLWQKNHSLSFYAQTAPEATEEVQVYSLTYLFKLASNNTMMALYTMRSNSEVAIAENSSVIIGKGDSYGAKWILPFYAQQKMSHNFTLSVDYKSNNEQIAVANTVENVSTPISYSVFGINYGLARFTEKTQTSLSLGPNFSFRGLSDQDVNCEFRQGGDVTQASLNELACKRGHAQSNFIYFIGEFSHKHEFPWGGAIQLNAMGQYSEHALVSGEQFSMGGANSVRGYPESHFLGDYGARTSLEIMTPNLPLKLKNTKTFLVGFVDSAAAFVNKPAIAQDKREGIYSVGVGGNIAFAKNFRAALDVAWPRRHSGEVKAGDWRSHFSVALNL